MHVLLHHDLYQGTDKDVEGHFGQDSEAIGANLLYLRLRLRDSVLAAFNLGAAANDDVVNTNAAKVEEDKEEVQEH